MTFDIYLSPTDAIPDQKEEDSVMIGGELISEGTSYNDIIFEAESLFDEGQYQLAKKFYRAASLRNPEDNVATRNFSLCDDMELLRLGRLISAKYPDSFIRHRVVMDAHLYSKRWDWLWSYTNEILGSLVDPEEILLVRQRRIQAGLVKSKYDYFVDDINYLWKETPDINVSLQIIYQKVVLCDISEVRESKKISMLISISENSTIPFAVRRMLKLKALQLQELNVFLEELQKKG